MALYFQPFLYSGGQSSCFHDAQYFDAAPSEVEGIVPLHAVQWFSAN